MAKSKQRRRKPQMTIPVAVMAGMMPLAASAVRGWQNETFRGLGKEVLFALTGFDTDQPGWHPEFMKNGTYPLVAGIVVHKLAGRLGINRMLGRARIPLLRI